MSSARSQPGSAAARGGLRAGRPDRRDRRPRDRQLRGYARASSCCVPDEQVDGRARARRPARCRCRSRSRAEEQRDRFGQTLPHRPARRHARRAADGRGCRPLELVPAATRYTVASTRSMIDGLWQIITGRPLGQGSGRAAQDRADRRAAGQPRLRSSSSSCSRCSRLIWDSSTCCQSRCSMAAILLSTRSRRSGGARSARGRRNGRSVAGWRSFWRCMLFVTVNDLASFGLLGPAWALDWLVRLGAGRDEIKPGGPERGGATH